MKKVFLEKYMNLAIVAEVDVAPLKMVDPVLTCVLNMYWEMMGYCVASQFAHKNTWHL